MDKFRIVDVLNESFALNERNKANKARKDAYIRSTGGRGNYPEGAYSDQEAYADNPHGSEGSMRGKKKVRGARPSAEQQRINTKSEINRRKRFIAANKEAVKAHRAELEGVAPKKKEKSMTNENFEAAFVRANAQIAFTIAEAMTTKVGAKLTPEEMKAREPKPGHRIVTAKRAVDEPKPRVIKAKPSKKSS